MALREAFGILIGAAVIAGACGGSEFSAGELDGGSGGAAGSRGTGGGAPGGGAGSGGTLGSGGTVGSGGAGVGGAAGSAGAGGSPDSCTAGSVAFKMIAGGTANAESYCTGIGCAGGSWVSVRTESGQGIGLYQGCIANCNDCVPIGCTDVCAIPQRMKPEGERTTWDGTFWIPSTCGAGMACSQRQCMPAGTQLTAIMCAYPSTDADASDPFCQSNSAAQCVEVPFMYPSEVEVVGVLNPVK
jgi:hypothetical protein